MTSELRPAVETRAEVVVEKLRALHVWPQIVADDHADLLTPRRIDKLYEVGRVSHEAADLIETQAREIERLRGDLEVARKEAGSNYRVALAWERTARAALGDSHDQ